MARLTAAQASQLDSVEYAALHAVRLDFGSGVVAAHDGLGSFTYSGDTYVGVGEFGSIEVVSEDISARPQSVSLTLTGVDPDLLSDAISDDYHLRDVNVYLVVIDPNDGTFIGDPVGLWAGYMDHFALEVAEQQATLTLHCMDRLANVTRPRVFYLTDEAQRRRFSGDRGLEFAPQAVREIRLDWGGRPVTQTQGGNDPGDTGSTGPGGTTLDPP